MAINKKAKIIIFLLVLLPALAVLVLLSPAGEPIVDELTALLTRYEQTVEHEGDLILEGDEELVIENTHYIQRGSIELRDRAPLIIRNSLFEMPNEYAGQWKLEAYGQSQFVMENSRFKMNQWVFFDFFQESSAVYRNNKRSIGITGNFGPWHLLGENTTLEVENSYFGGTIADESQWRIKDSSDLFIEILIGGEDRSTKADESGLTVGKRIDRWEFPNEGEEGISHNILIENSTVKEWGIAVNPKSSFTLRDSEEINICFPIFSPEYQEEDIHFSNLRQQHYGDFTVSFLDAELRLLNTSVSGWCLSTWKKNTITVTDSNLDDISRFGGESKGVFERITARVVIAEQDVELYIKDSIIKGDVTARDNSIVILENTEVEGKITEEGNGKVIVR